jgi:undecaprenyl-diphosphatase
LEVDFLGIFESIVLGLVQGLTEFLPVSSSGHLVMFQKLLGVEENLFLTVALHLGTLIAVFIVYAKDIWEMIKNPFSSKVKKLVVATIPTVLIVFLLKGAVETSFSSYFFILGFLITAILLIITQNKQNKTKELSQNKEISYKSSLIIGIAQGLACFPGISRSGSTICAGILAGENKDECANFSFLLSIPIIIASCCYELIFNFQTLTFNLIPVLVGMFVAMVSGIIAIRVMLKIVHNVKFNGFAIYLFILSIIMVIFFNCF